MRNKPFRLNFDSFKGQIFDLMLGSGDGKRLLASIDPTINSLIFVVRTTDGDTRFSNFGDAVKFFNGDIDD